jgi:hypothetical protein
LALRDRLLAGVDGRLRHRGAAEATPDQQYRQRYSQQSERNEELEESPQAGLGQRHVGRVLGIDPALDLGARREATDEALDLGVPIGAGVIPMVGRPQALPAVHLVAIAPAELVARARAGLDDLARIDPTADGIPALGLESIRRRADPVPE